MVKFDFEQGYFHEKPLPVLDHCVIEVDEVYHLYYLRGNPAVDVGRASTTDFKHWQLKEPVLEPGDWDYVMWAPQLFQVPGWGWYMFYTGVNSFGAQQTGLAVSSTLDNWFKYPGPVYNPDPAWALWDETTWCHGRDPHVIEYNGKYYMFVTAKTVDSFGAVACAVSDDLFNWTDIGPIYVHDTWHVMESVFIMQRNGKFHMFFTEEIVNGTSHMASDDLLSGWDIANRRIIDSGHAPQVTQLSDGTEIFSRHAVYNNGVDENFHVHRFDELAWAGDIPAPYKPWALADDWNLIWGNAFAFQPVFRNNPKARGATVADTFEGNCWIGTYERYTGPLGFGTPGGIQGDSRTGVIRSKPFTVAGNSMNLLVGGGDDIDMLYVALVDAATTDVLYKETGSNSEEMDRRFWDLKPHKGREVYVEIADLSTGAWGHINCDDITESWEILYPDDGDDPDNGAKGMKNTGVLQRSEDRGAPPSGKAVLFQNSPNPFNPATKIAYEVPGRGRVTLRVYDVNGKLVRELVDDEQPAGPHAVTWNGQDSAGRRVVSGVYLYRLTFDGAVVNTRKMLMLK
jgi:predicted GH43/DUF377 family glycosyl hydrolase